MANLLDRTNLAIVMAASLSLGVVIGMPARCEGQPQTRPIDAPPCRSVLGTHHGQLQIIYASNDFKSLIAYGYDHNATIWDVATGTRRHFIRQEPRGDSLMVWDVISASQKRLILEQPGSAENTTFSLGQDASHMIIIMTGSEVESNNGIYLYNLNNGKLRRIYQGREDNHSEECVTGPNPEFSMGSGPNKLAYCVGTFRRGSGITYRIRIDDLKETAPAINISDELGFKYTGLAYSHDGRMFCTVCQHRNARKASLPVGRVTLWDPRTGERIGRVNTGGRYVFYPSFSPNGRDLALLGGNVPNLIYICSTTEMDVRRTLTDFAKKPGHGQMPISKIEYTADGSYMTAWGPDGTIMFWETNEYREVLWMKLYPKDTLQWVCFSRDGRMLATGGKKDEWDTVKFWDLDQFRALMDVKKAGPGAAPPR